MRSRRKGLPDACGPEQPYTHRMDETREAKGTTAPEILELSEEECELCGMEMFGLHCKLVCPNCGYRRDCSDP